jgi:VIT1/CCC1 family predicted Fe2+/Mn2+ transporter
MVLLSGIAGLLAGAFSMAAGEYVSVRSQRELYEYQIGLEREELALYPTEEAEEMALIYNARGVPMADARRIACEIIKDPGHALDTLAREELGLNPEDLGSPWGAALASFTAFAAGAMVPLLPFAAGLSTQAVPLAGGLAVAALFAVGVSMSLFTGRSALWSGLRMVLIGGGAGLGTYLIGSVLGVALG